jgi:WD40 repeat protein
MLTLFAASILSLPTSLYAQRPDSTTPALTFRKVMSAPAEFDDNFTHAVIAVSAEHKSLIARNYIRMDSREQIKWLREHPERRGNRLFGLDPINAGLTHLPDSTRFGFIPNSPVAFLVVSCTGNVRLWDTRERKIIEVEFAHDLASENAGPNPAVSPDGKIMVTQTSNTLRRWDLQTLTATGPELEHDWCWDLAFSSDGKWLFTRGVRQMRIRSAGTGEPVAGPFRHDLIAGGFAYDAGSQRLATFENNSEEDAEWSSAAVIRSGQDWSDSERIQLSGHTREVRWIDGSHILAISDVRQPGKNAPHTYDKNTVSLITLKGDKPEVQIVTRHPWIRNAAVAPDAGHVIVTTRDWTSCWQLGETEPIWNKRAEYIVSPGDGGWVLLHRGETAVICSLTTGKEIRRWDNVVASRRDGSTVWLCNANGIEVWRAQPTDDDK